MLKEYVKKCRQTKKSKSEKNRRYVNYKKSFIRQYEHIFTDVPGNANIIEHEVKLMLCQTSPSGRNRLRFQIPYNVRESFN